MAKRRYFIAGLIEGGKTIAMAETNAWNSAVRASEGLVRNYARDRGFVMVGDKPETYGPVAQPGSTYRRSWVGEGARVRVEVAEVTS